MSIYEDILSVTPSQQSPNARFRNEFIRANLQNPDQFYSKYRDQLAKQQQEQQAQQQVQPGSPRYTAPYTQPTNLGTGLATVFRESGSMDGGRIPNIAQTGGIFGTSPNMGSLIGTGLGLAGAPFSGLLGQVASGTQESIQNAAIGTVGSTALGSNWGPVSEGLGYAVHGRMPTTTEAAHLAARAIPATAPFVGAYDTAKSISEGKTADAIGNGFRTVAMLNPATAPLAALYGIGRSTVAVNNERLADNYRKDAMYGFAPVSPYGPETTFSGMFGNPSNLAKDEDGTGLSSNMTSMGLGFTPLGQVGYTTPGEMGIGTGLTPGKQMDITGALSAMFGDSIQMQPETPTYNGMDNYTNNTFNGGDYGTSSTMQGPPEATSPAVTSGLGGLFSGYQDTSTGNYNSGNYSDGSVRGGTGYGGWSGED